MSKKSIHDNMRLVVDAGNRAKRATTTAAKSATDTAFAVQLAYPEPESMGHRAANAAVRVTRTSAANALRQLEEVEELISKLAAEISRT